MTVAPTKSSGSNPTAAMRRRTTRACVTVIAIGLALTASTFVITRDVVGRLDRQRVEGPAAAALLGVQQLSSAVDQVLATAGGVVAATDGDPVRFDAVLGPDVTSSSTLAGIALVERAHGVVHVAAAVGNTALIAGRTEAVLAADASATLVGHRSSRTTFDLGLAASLPAGRAVFLQIAVPVRSHAGASFALAEPDAKGFGVVLGNVGSVAGLTRWNGAVVLGGRQFTLFVAPDRATSALAGAQLPLVTLIVGLLLTIAAALVARTVVRRNIAVGALQTENRDLDLAIEQQRRIEIELLDSQARFRAMLRDSPDAIALLHLASGTCEILNRTSFLGHAVEQLAAPNAVLDLVHDDDRAEADSVFERLRTLGDDRTAEVTLRMRTAEAQDRFVRLRFSPLRNADDDSDANANANAVAGDEWDVTLLGLFSDVTDDWEKAQREAELQEALRQSQRLESVGQLAGGVAHDFNNLLAAIQASAELLEGDVPAGRPEEYRQEIEHAAQRGAALTRQLLTFANRDRTVARSVDLAEVVTGIESLLRRTLSAGVQLQLTTPVESCNVFADPTQLEQVVLNLALNGRDAMPDGGVLWIAVRVDGEHTDEHTDDDPGIAARVVLSVTDTGTGIDPGVRDRIFDPFVTTKEPGKGTGLGLASVRSIADAVGGQITVTSEPGLGTTFEISFARCADGGAVRPSEVLDDELDGRGLRLLLVEDEGAVRSALAHTLERRHFDVVAVGTASEALRELERESFDLVLTDLMMPGMSGRELIDRIEASGRELAIVAMTGYLRSTDDELPEGVSLLRKPFTNTQLFSTLRSALRRTAIDVETNV